MNHPLKCFSKLAPFSGGLKFATQISPLLDCYQFFVPGKANYSSQTNSVKFFTSIFEKPSNQIVKVEKENFLTFLMVAHFCHFMSDFFASVYVTSFLVFLNGMFSMFVDIN